MRWFEIEYKDPLSYANALVGRQLAFLDSARFHPQLGRYSFIGFDPFDQFIAFEDHLIFSGKSYPASDIFTFLKNFFKDFTFKKDERYPFPFAGGAIGYFSYDLVRKIEKIGELSVKDNHFPLIHLYFYDVFLAFDHANQKAFLVASGLSPLSSESNCRKILSFLNQVKKKITDIYFLETDEDNEDVNLTSNFSKEYYLETVNRIKKHIVEGDIFQANLSQRFSGEIPSLEAWELYKNLRKVNPAPFSAYIGCADTKIASTSPERFLFLKDKAVQARPIKGTRPRSTNSLQDEALAEELLKSEKDKAENAMIVDLMRNDLSRVCEEHTVKVSQWCGLESFETVHHLVSVVEGRLRREYDAFDLLKATFPGGSITGAPKIRAMQILESLEPTQRGPYCGSIGYISFDGSMDLSIVIRTLLIEKDHVSFQVGGGIVLDSDAEAEYQETLIKARALEKALKCYQRMYS